MKKELMKEFNSNMACAKLECITIKESKCKRYELTTWTCIKDEVLSDNLQTTIFVNEHDAKDAFKVFVISWL